MNTGQRAAIIVTGAAIACQIGYPLLHGAARDSLSIVIVAALAMAALTHATATFGWRYAVIFGSVTAGVGLFAEILGTATCVPFGCYRYGERLGVMVGSVDSQVPLLIAAAWTAGAYPVWTVAGLISRSRLARVALTALGMVGWDLYLDPQMVADGHWSWVTADQSANLPGMPQIPLTNFVGWFVVGLVIAALLAVWTPQQPTLDSRFSAPIAIFVWTWLGSAVAHVVFLGHPQLRVSAAYGLVGMGLLGLPLVVQTWRGYRLEGDRRCAAVERRAVNWHDRSRA